MNTKKALINDLTSHPESTISEICRRTGLARSTVRHHLRLPPFTRQLTFFKVDPSVGKEPVDERVEAVVASIRKILTSAPGDQKSE